MLLLKHEQFVGVDVRVVLDVQRETCNMDMYNSYDREREVWVSWESG